MVSASSVLCARRNLNGANGGSAVFVEEGKVMPRSSCSSEQQRVPTPPS